MKIVKNSLLLVFISLITLTGCKKDDSDSDSDSSSSSSANMTLELGDIICTMDGIPRKFSFGGSSEMIKSNVNHYDDSYLASPTGKVIQCGRYDESIQMFTIDIFKDLDKIKIPTTYTSTSIDFENYEDDDSNGIEFWLSYTSISDMSMYMSWHPKGSSKITITSKKNDILEGTFEGWLFSESVDIMDFNLNSEEPPESTIDSIRVTDGKFKIQLVRESLLHAIEYFENN